MKSWQESEESKSSWIAQKHNVRCIAGPHAGLIGLALSVVLRCLLLNIMLPPCVFYAAIYLFFACSLHILRILHIAGRGSEQSIIIVLRNQKSEPKEIAAIEFAAAAIGSWLSTELLDSLVRSGGEQARVDSIATATANGGFLCSLLHNLLWYCNWLSGLFRSRRRSLLSFPIL